MSLWFMIPITIVDGVYKPSYNWGGHIVHKNIVTWDILAGAQWNCLLVDVHPMNRVVRSLLQIRFWSCVYQVSCSDAAPQGGAPPVM